MSQPERKDSHIEVLENPTEFWGLKYREGGRQNLAVSFDGPPSPAYQAFIKKSAYDALKAENERLKKQVGDSRLYAQDRDAAAKEYKKERDRALEMLRKMAGALDKIIEAHKAKQWKGVEKYWGAIGFAISEARPLAAEYRKEFGDNK